MPTSAPAQTVRRRAPTRTREFAFFLFLNLIGFSFFSLVLDNTYWHGDDWEYLIQALRIGEHWTEIFSTRLHQTFQPIPNLVFFLEFQAFHIDARAYYLFNIFVHSINAFLVYLLVRTMLKDRAIAVLSGFLFEFAVGNFGKSVMTVSRHQRPHHHHAHAHHDDLLHQERDRGARRVVEEELHPVPHLFHAEPALQDDVVLAAGAHARVQPVLSRRNRTACVRPQLHHVHRALRCSCWW